MGCASSAPREPPTEPSLEECKLEASQEWLNTRQPFRRCYRPRARGELVVAVAICVAAAHFDDGDGWMRGLAGYNCRVHVLYKYNLCNGPSN